MATASGRSSKVKTSVAIPQVGWRQARPATVVLVTGPEEFLAERAITGIRQQLRAADPSLEVSDVDAATYASGQLLTLASPSLFGEPRLIRVTSVEKCSDEFIEDVVSYLQAPDADTTLVLRHGGGVRGKKILDTVRLGSGSGIEVIVDELKSDNDKFEFAAAEFAAGERRITPGAVRGLVAAFSSNGAELAAACQQLMSDTTGDIDERDVDTYYGGRAEATAFRVADIAIAGRPGDALVSLRNALESGADPVPLVAAFASKLRIMARVMGDRRSAGELAGVIGAAPWQIDRARRDLSGWSEGGLASAIVAVAAADANVKGATRDPVYALERMVNIVANYGLS